MELLQARILNKALDTGIRRNPTPMTLLLCVGLMVVRMGSGFKNLVSFWKPCLATSMSKLRELRSALLVNPKSMDPQQRP